MTVVASTLPIARGLDPRARAHDRGCPHSRGGARRLGSALLGLSPSSRQVAGDFLQPDLDRRLRLLLLHPEHAAALRAADPDRPCLRHSRPHRPHPDRRRRARWCSAASRRLRSRSRSSPAAGRRFIGLPIMALLAMLVGAVWIGLAGWLRHYRGVNETISSLLLSYIAIAIMNFFVEGALRDPASANKPSTMPIGDAYRIGAIPGTSVHWGLAAGIVLAVVLYILMSRTTFGFAARMTGGNVRAAQAQGLAGRRAGGRLLRHRGRLRRARRLLRGRGHPRPGQRLARRGLRLHRHPRRLPRAAEPAGGRAGRDPVRRTRRRRRAGPAPHGDAGRHRAGAAGHDLRGAAGQRDLLRPHPLPPAEARAETET